MIVSAVGLTAKGSSSSVPPPEPTMNVVHRLQYKAGLAPARVDAKALSADSSFKQVSFVFECHPWRHISATRYKYVAE